MKDLHLINQIINSSVVGFKNAIQSKITWLARRNLKKNKEKQKEKNAEI